MSHTTQTMTPEQVQQQRDDLYRALQELVYLKDLKQLAASAFAAKSADAEQLAEEYYRREPIAWQRARDLLLTMCLVVLIAVAGVAQIQCTLTVTNGGSMHEINWAVISNNGTILAARGDLYGSSYLPDWIIGQYDVSVFTVPFEQLRLRVIDTGCDGMPEGGSIQLLTVMGGNTSSFTITGTIGNGYQADYYFMGAAEILFETSTIQCPCIPSTPMCPADINNDGVIGIADLLLFITAFGSTCAP